MIRRVAAVVTVGLALVATGCADDGDDTDDAAASTVTTSPSGGPVTDECVGCRHLDVGEDPDVDGMSVGVRQCDDGRCELVVLDRAEGSETVLDVGPGDTLDIGDGWIVVLVTATGLTIRPT